MKINGSKRGRPAKFVLDPNGRPIVGLSCSNGNYYATYSEPRVWFGSDYAEALFKFQRYQNQQAIEEPHIEIQMPNPPGPHQPQIVKWSELCGNPPIIAAAHAGESALLPENLFFETARNFILKDPIEAARKFGIPELSRMTDLPPLEPPLYLDKILQYYLEHRKPSPEECKKMKMAWREFCRIISVNSVREISSNRIHDYRDIIWAEYEKGGWSSTWLKARFSRVKTLFNYNFKNGRTNKRELQTVIDFCKCLSVTSSIEEPARPIERNHVHKLLEHCNCKWQAIILLALNCGYYAKDIHDFKVSMIMGKNEMDYVVFPREKNKHMRVNVLWKETKEALDKYLSEKKHNTDFVFTSQYGTPLTSHDVQRCFDRLRKRAGVPDEVKFNNFRDGAASALFGKVESDLLKVTIGHRIKGEKSKYISVKPEQVKICADIIHDEYFGEIGNGKEARIHLAAS
jgi:integrase